MMSQTGRMPRTAVLASIVGATLLVSHAGLLAVSAWLHGPSRAVKIGPLTIQLRRTTARNMAAAGRLSGLLIQALRELGKEHVTPERLAHLQRTLPARKRKKLITDIRLAPAWMHPIFRELAEEAA